MADASQYPAAVANVFVDYHAWVLAANKGTINRFVILTILIGGLVVVIFAA